MPRENGERVQTRSQKSENKRQLENSPSETVPTSIEKRNKLSEMDVATTLLEIQKQLASMSIAINASSSKIDVLSSSISAITNDISEIKNDIGELKNANITTNEKVEAVDNRLAMVENSQQASQSVLASYAAQLNTLEQLNLGTKLAIHNLPLNIDMAVIINDLSQWSNCTLDNSTIAKSTLAKARNKRSASLYVEFCNTKTKIDFLKFCKSAQRDKDGKYSPVTPEMIFKLPNNHAGRGLEMQFREILTDTNNMILKEIRNETKKKSIRYHWLDNGNYL